MTGSDTLKSAAVVACLAALPSCVSVKHEVQPIHITMDINVRVQRELEDFFSFEDQLLKNPGGTPATQPAAAPPPPGN